MIRGDGYEVEIIDSTADARRTWVPVEFFATHALMDARGQIAFVLVTYSFVDGRMRTLATDRIRRCNLD